jgi:hypothetical protein
MWFRELSRDKEELLPTELSIRSIEQNKAQ